MERIPEFIANHLFLVSLLIALLILLGWNLYGDVLTGAKHVGPQQMTQLINRENAIVVDIRSSDDYKNIHIINAINIPSAELESRRQKELDKYKDSTVVVYCQNGSESGRIIRTFKQAGYKSIYSLKGGLLAWQNANLPIARDQA